MNSVIVNSMIVENVEKCPNCKTTSHITVTGKINSIRVQCKKCGLNHGKVFPYPKTKKTKEKSPYIALNNAFLLWNKKTLTLSGKKTPYIAITRDLSLSEITKSKKEEMFYFQNKVKRKLRKAFKPN